MKTPSLITNPAELLRPMLERAAVEQYGQKPSFEQFNALMQKHLAEGKERQGKLKKYLSMSEMDSCQRSIAYQFYTDDYPAVDNTSPEQALTRDTAAVLGKALHSAWEMALISSGLIPTFDNERISGSEVWVSDIANPDIKDLLWNHYRMVGRADFITDTGAPDWMQDLNELKGVSQKDFDNFSRWWDPWPPFFFKPAQLQLEMWALDKPRARLVVVNREGKWFEDVLEFWYERDEGMIQELLYKAETIQFTVASGNLPAKQPGVNYSNCRFCKFRGYCQPEIK